MEYVKNRNNGYTNQGERGKSMLAETVRNNLKDVQNLNMRTKATKFSRLFQSDPTITIEEAPLEEILEACNLRNYIKKDNESADVDVESSISSEDSEVEDYIVENPNEVIVQFPIASNIELNEKLPFFKALSLKLANL